MRALALTGAGLIRALEGAAKAAAERAVAERAERLAEGLADELADAGAVEIAAAGPGARRVTVAAPGLFGREFGSVEAAGEPVVAPAVARLAGR